MATYRTILTTKGKQLVAAAAASGSAIVLTDMGVGDGNGNPVTPSESQTSLARERYRHQVNTLAVDATDATRFIAELVVPADIGGFTMREVGLYTADGDLFAVANVPNAYKPTDTEGSFGDTIIRMVFIVSNANVITLVVDPNIAVATRSWVLNNVNAASIIPGGITGQLLAKKSNADGDTEWIDVTEGITVIVFSREETQTLAASQTVIDLAEITAEGAAVYVEGVRLRKDQFSQTTDTRITLAQSYPAGSKVTIVQNEEVGVTDMLLRPNNLSDVPDKDAARTNLGLPNWLASSQINWSQLINLPSYATRWPSFAEVTDKPATYPPSYHTQTWDTITSVPDTANRWPTWNEVTSKPSLFPPAAHTHAEYVAKTGDTMTGPLQVSRVSSSNADSSRSISIVEAGVAGENRRLDIALQDGAGATAREIRFRGILNSKMTFETPNGSFTQDITASGSIYAAGGMNSANGYFVSGSPAAVLSATGGGSIYFRPNGYGSSTGAATLSAAGNLQLSSTSSTPGNGIRSFACQTTGQYGGGYGLIDGANEIGMYSVSGALNFGFGSNSSAITSRATLSAAGAFNPTGGIDTGSSIKLKDVEGPMPYGLAEVERIETVIGRYKPAYNDDDRRRLFMVAEQLAGLIPEAVDMEGVEFNGEKVPSIKIEQMLPVFVRAIQQLSARVRELEARSNG